MFEASRNPTHRSKGVSFCVAMEGSLPLQRVLGVHSFLPMCIECASTFSVSIIPVLTNNMRTCTAALQGKAVRLLPLWFLRQPCRRGGLFRAFCWRGRTRRCKLQRGMKTFCCCREAGKQTYIYIYSACKNY